jgi:hypothetical protein
MNRHPVSKPSAAERKARKVAAKRMAALCRRIANLIK